MSKPASFNDLPAWQREPHRLVTVGDRAAFDRIPGATVAFGQFLDTCRAAGALMSPDGTDIALPLTEEELERKLEQAREQWDRFEKLYERWIETGDEPPYGAGASVRKWAEQEDRMSPEEALASRPADMGVEIVVKTDRGQ